MDSIKVLIVDDHPLVREGLKELIKVKDEIEVIDTAETAKEAIDIIAKENVDVVLMDIYLPDMNGFEVIDKVKKENNQVKFIVFTAYEEVACLVKSLDAGAHGYLIKDAPIEMIREAISTVYKGESFIQPKLASQYIYSLHHKKESIDSNDRYKLLTKRELQILKLIGRGLTNNEISKELGISEETVKNHVSKIFKKLKVKDRTKAAVYAISHNLVQIN